MDYFFAHWLTLLGGVLLGGSVGVLTGLFGAGGGFVITPALNIFLGFPMGLAVGTSACQVLGASSLALYHQKDKKFSGLKVALHVVIGVPLGAWIGGLMVERLKAMPNWTINGHSVPAVNLALLVVFLLLLFSISSWLIYDNFVRRKDEDESGHIGVFAKFAAPPVCRYPSIVAGEFSAPLLVVIGFIMGFVSSLLGVGGGVIMMPILFYLVGQDTKSAAKTSVMLIFATGLFSTIFHVAHGNVNYPMVAALITGAFFGTRGGVALQKMMTGKSLRRYFAFVVLAAAVMVGVKLVLKII